MSMNQPRGNSKTYFVLLLELHDGRQIDKCALHTIQPLDDKHNLLPGPVSLRLSLADNLSQKILQARHIIMLEHADVRPAQPHPKPNRRVVQLIRNDQTPLVHQRGDERRVGREAHRADQRIFHAEKLGN